MTTTESHYHCFTLSIMVSDHPCGQLVDLV